MNGQGGLGKLFENQLFLQYLSGAGSAMSAGEPIGPAINQVTQQQISNRNFMKMLQRMMSGEVPEGGKITMDSKGMKMDVPKSALGGLETPFSVPKSEGGSGITWTGENIPSIFNPSGSPAASASAGPGAAMARTFGGYTGSELAGLTPEMISQAMQFKMAGEELKDKRVSEMVDALYKGKMMEYYDTLIGEKTPSVTIPGTDIQLTREQYIDWYKVANKDERTAAVKNYEYAKSQGYTGNFMQFQDAAKTTHEKDYQKALSQGYTGSFNEWMLDMAKAGAITIGEITGRAEATADVKAKKYFTDPEGLVSDVDKYVNSEEVQDKLFQYAGDARGREIETVRAKEKFIRTKIAAAGGEIVGEKLEGRTFVFTVKWRDGSTSEVRYAN